ncbi:hypothetical protein MRX96_004081 [Rhipicephalus microplus]
MIFACQRDSYLRSFKTRVVACNPVVDESAGGCLRSGVRRHRVISRGRRAARRSWTGGRCACVACLSQSRRSGPRRVLGHCGWRRGGDERGLEAPLRPHAATFRPTPDNCTG